MESKQANSHFKTKQPQPLQHNQVSSQKKEPEPRESLGVKSLNQGQDASGCLPDLQFSVPEPRVILCRMQTFRPYFPPSLLPML